MSANSALLLPQEIARRSAAGAPIPAQDHATPLTQCESVSRPLTHRDLSEEDPLGLQEIRKKMGIAVRSLLSRRKAKAIVSAGSDGSGSERSDEIIERVRAGMDRARSLLEGKRSEAKPRISGLDWCMASERDLVCNSPIKVINLQMADVSTPLEYEPQSASTDPGALGLLRAVGTQIEQKADILPDEWIQHKEQRGTGILHGNTNQGVRNRPSEECCDMICEEGTRMIRQERIWDFNISQTGDPPDTICDHGPENTDSLPSVSKGRRNINSRGEGKPNILHPTNTLTRHTMENKGDRKMKKVAAESKLEIIASSGGERGDRRLERGSSSHGGRDAIAPSVPQAGLSSGPMENRGVAAVELDLTKARAAMATRWLAVGYFFSVLPFSTVGLFGEPKSKWGLRGRLSYTPLRNNRFMLEFEREGDRRHVLENGPWTHRKDAFLIVPFDGQGKASKVEVNTMPIWARIYDVPPLMLSEEIGWKLGGLLGEVLRVDADKFGNIFSEFLCVCVKHNVNTPLLREISSRELGDDEWMD